jgi:uncharacterized protein YwlG (UPF0340 family)
MLSFFYCYRVRTHKRKGFRPKILEQTIQKDIRSVKFGNVGISTAADIFKSPYKTLRNLIAKICLIHALQACEDINLMNVEHSNVLGADVENGNI